MLRRLKTEVLRDLIPGKKLVEVPCALTPYQRRLYITILKKNYKELNKGVKNGIIVYPVTHRYIGIFCASFLLSIVVTTIFVL